MRGRKPKPASLKLLEGNRAKVRLKKLEAQAAAEPSPEIPDCPPHLNREARREWKRITLLLFSMGLICRADRGVLSGYCTAWSNYVMAEKELKKFGPIIKTPSGYPITSPYLQICNKSLELMRKYMAELGLSPSARTRLNVVQEKKSDDLMETILNGTWQPNGHN